MTDHFFKTREEIHVWLDEMEVEDYIINDDLTVDVGGGVDISYRNLAMIPVQFGVVNGNFNCNTNGLISLKGAPHACGDFRCSWNQLTSLDGAPRACGEFWCSGNHLTSLDGAPETCQKIVCIQGNPDLHDISAAPDGCSVSCNQDTVAKNQATRQLAALDGGNANDVDGFRRKSGRIL